MSFDASALIRGLGDTIVAVSTAAGFAERGVVRVSGDRAVDVAQAWFECAEGIDDDLRYGVRDGSFRLGNSGVVVSASLWVMRAPRSYTGEDQVEIHLVGSPTLLDVVVDLCCRAGARAAAPGEFTRRALFNGRLDLTQAEAVGALVTAATEDERRAAIEVLDGSVKIRTDAMTETLMAWLATIELDLDFSDQDIDIEPPLGLEEGLRSIIGELERFADERACVLRFSARPRVVLRGPASVGKSSLFNALLSDDRAITHAAPGTTRDLLEATLDLEGMEVVLVDTAGEGHRMNEIDDDAHALRDRELERADLVLRVVDGRSTDPRGDVGDDEILVLSHADLVPEDQRRGPGLWVAAPQGTGLEALREGLAQSLRARRGGAASALAALRDRHADCLDEAADALCDARNDLESGRGMELVAAGIHQSLAAFRALTGQDYDEAVVDRILAAFCIGK